jgi:hypothetical protein
MRELARHCGVGEARTVIGKAMFKGSQIPGVIRMLTSFLSLASHDATRLMAQFHLLLSATELECSRMFVGISLNVI